MDFVWAAVGALLGILFSAIYEFAGNLRSPANLRGTWNSTWQPTSSAGWDWVTEDLDVRRSPFGIRLRNRNNAAGFEWEGKGNLVRGTYLIGEWQSRKPGSNSEGVFALTYATDGNCLLGFFLSRDLDRGKIASGFVLGRTPQDMKEGRRKLESMRIRYPKSDPPL